MKRILQFIAFMAVILLNQTISAQTSSFGCETPVDYMTCDEATDCIICEFDILEGFTEVMSSDLSADGPSPLCPNGGAVHNSSWFAFVAGSTTITMDLILFDCDTVEFPPGSGQDLTGIQYGVYTDCSFNNSVVCEPNCVDDAVNPIVLNGLTEGDTYYFFLDGCGGSACTYEITNVTGGGIPNIDESAWSDPTCADPVDGACKICAGATDFELVFPGITANIEYTWTVSGGAGTATFTATGFGGGVFFLSDDVLINFPDAGTYEVCVTADNGCDEDVGTYCTEFEVEEIQDENFTVEWCENEYDEFDITQTTLQTDNPNMDCEDDGWQGPDPSGPGVITHTVTDGFGLGCVYDQILTTTDIPLEPTIVVVTAVCFGSSVDVGPNSYNSEVINDIVEDNHAAANGCDQFYDITVYLFEYELSISDSECTDDGVKLTLNHSSEGSSVGQTENWIWTFNGVDIAGTENMECIFADPAMGAGAYNVSYTVECTNCDTPVSCTFEPDFPVNFNPDDYQTVLLPEWEVPFSSVCEGENSAVVYTLDDLGLDPSTYTVTWTIDPPNEGAIAGGQGTNSVTIDWTNMTGDAQICYVIENACSTFEGGCYDILLIANPEPEIDGPSEICVGTETFFDILNELSTYDSLVVDWGDGVVVTGMDPGPYTVSWPQGTTLDTVTVIIGYGCNNPVVDTLFLSLMEDPVFPMANCLPSGSTIIIDWPDVPGADTYLVNETMGSGGTLNGSQYEFTGLVANDEVCIEVIAQGAGLCADVVSTEICCTLPDCPDADLEAIVNDIPASICLDGTETIGNLTIVDNEGNGGTGTYSGPGITNSTPGSATFDPADAGPGTHLIEYVYEYSAGCFAPFSYTVEVIQPPSYTIDVDPAVVCAGDPVSININGLVSDDGNPTIDFDGGDAIGPDADGNYTVTWATGGMKNIGGVLAVAGCGDVIAGASVEVETLPTLDIECINTTTTSITFGWTDDAVFDSYDILVEGEFVDNVTGDTYTFSGLNPDSTITIQIFGNSNNSCVHEIEVKPCTANDCENVPFSIMNPLPSTIICGSAPFDPISLTGVYDPSLLMGGETINWTGTDPDGNSFNISNGEFTPTTPGSYTIDANLVEGNCSYGASISFDVEDVPDLALMSNADVICIEDTWMLEYTGDPVGDFTFSWTGMPADGDDSMLSQNIDFSNPGLYNLTLNASSDNCMSTGVPISVEVVDSTRTPVIFCEPGIDTIHFEWIVPPSDCNGMYTILINGNVEEVTSDNFYNIYNLGENEQITFEVINENEDCICSAKSAVEICSTESCPTTPVEVSVMDTTICLDDMTMALDLDAIYDNTVLSQALESWSGTGVDPTTGVFDPNQTGGGTFSIDLMIQNGSCDYGATSTINVEVVPELSLMAVEEICIEDTWIVTYDGDNVGNFDITWSGNFSPIDQVGLDQDVEITFSEPGDYVLYLDAATENCDAIRDSVIVKVLDSILTPQITCNSFVDSVVIEISVDNSECSGDLFIDADLPGFPQLVLNNSFTMPLNPGESFEFTVTNTNTCACPDKISGPFVCEASPCEDGTLEIVADQLVYCLDGTTSSISLMALFEGSGVTTGLTWNGQNIGTDGVINIDASIMSGNYTYDLAYVNGSCDYITNIELSFVDPPILDYEVIQPNCPEDEQGTFGLLMVEDGVDYFINGNAFNPDSQQSLNPGSYDILVESGGVCSVTESFTIDAAPEASFTIGGPQEVPFDGTANYNIDASGGITIDSIVWTTTDTSSVGSNFEFSSANPVELCATIYFNGGCVTELCRELSVEAKKVYIPNIFSPGSNDQNGGFQIFSNDVIENVNSFKIYDRWGNMVFNQEDKLPGDPDLIWYGDFNGEQLVQGVYIYVIELQMIGDQVRMYRGDVTLIR